MALQTTHTTLTGEAPGTAPTHPPRGYPNLWWGGAGGPGNPLLGSISECNFFLVFQDGKQRNPPGVRLGPGLGGLGGVRQTPPPTPSLPGVYAGSDAGLACWSCREAHAGPPWAQLGVHGEAVHHRRRRQAPRHHEVQRGDDEERAAGASSPIAPPWHRRAQKDSGGSNQSPTRMKFVTYISKH